MQKQVLNYRIIIEPEKMGRKTVYNACCPTLGLADYGDLTSVAIHPKPVPSGTLRAILKQTQLKPEELKKLL